MVSMRVFHACDPSSILGRGIYWYSINIIAMNDMDENHTHNKVIYFKKLVERVKGYGTRQAISQSTLLRKGPREAKQAIKNGEARLVLVSGNLRPPEVRLS